MTLLANRVKMTTATTGTGTLTLGSAVTSFFTFGEAGVADAQEVTYQIEEGANVEIGRGVYTSAGATLTRATVLASKIAGVAGTSKINLGGAGVVSIVAAKEDLPLFAGAPAHGDILYRNGTDWARLAAGTNRQRLITRGSGADPEWGGGHTNLASGNLPAAATLTLTDIPQHFVKIVLTLSNLSHNDAGNRQPAVQPSTDNGSTFLTTAASYVHLGLTGGPATFQNLGTVASMLASTDSAAAELFNVTLEIDLYSITTVNGKPFRFRVNRNSGATHHFALGHLFLSNPINALQVSLFGAGVAASGSFDNGSYILFGVS